METFDGSISTIVIIYNTKYSNFLCLLDITDARFARTVQLFTFYTCLNVKYTCYFMELTYNY